MDEAFEKSEVLRLEDLITLAKSGEKINASVELEKQILSHKPLDIYLLVANYLFRIGGEIKKVSKIYGSGIVMEQNDVAKHNSFIANKRLDTDYERLESSHITVEKKFWGS